MLIASKCFFFWPELVRNVKYRGKTFLPYSSQVDLHCNSAFVHWSSFPEIQSTFIVSKCFKLSERQTYKLQMWFSYKNTFLYKLKWLWLVCCFVLVSFSLLQTFKSRFHKVWIWKSFIFLYAGVAVQHQWLLASTCWLGETLDAWVTACLWWQTCRWERHRSLH